MPAAIIRSSLPAADLIFEGHSLLSGAAAARSRIFDGHRQSRTGERASTPPETRWRTVSLVFAPEMGGNGDTGRNRPIAKAQDQAVFVEWDAPAKPGNLNHTIFEGTSEIQQLVIARAISGLRIE
jgi:hypothetical protein